MFRQCLYTQIFLAAAVSLCACVCVCVCACVCVCVCVCVWIHLDCVCESDKKEHSDQWKDELITMSIVMSETLSVEKNVKKTLSE